MKRKTDNFSKFYNKKNNAAIKEAFRQEKKAAKKERKEGIERHFEEKRKAREQQFASGKPAGPGPGKKDPPAFTPKRGSAASPSKGAASPASAPGSKAPVPGSKVSVPASKPSAPSGVSADPNSLPLNKYIAHGGICSRRDAAELIRLGKVQVNGQLITEPGTKVSPDDIVKINGKTVTISRNFVYILLNKPKDYITTTDDPQGRKTVLDLIRQATSERVFPVGRLDRNTSGVLLLTNDGDLAQKLAHPKHEIKKIYHVSLDKPLTKADFDQIASGVTLEDGLAYVDVLAYADAKDKTQIGLEIHSGRNRIVRRIFEHLGYDVRGLDRVMYAGLTKKNVQRGHWRLLSEKEIRILKYLNSSFRGSLSAPKSHKPGTEEKTDAPDTAAPSKAPESRATPASRPPGHKKFKRTTPGGQWSPGSKKSRSSGKGSPTNPVKGSAAGPAKGSSKDSAKVSAPGPAKASAPRSARGSASGSSKASAKGAPNGGLRGRKSSGSYIRSKAKSQQTSKRSPGRRPH